MALADPLNSAADSPAALATTHDAEVGVVERGLVPTREAANLLGVSEATLLRRAQELGGKRGPRGRWLFELERLRVVREDGSARALARPAVAHEHLAGERDARVVAQLEAGQTIASIVVAEKVTIETVLKLRALWLQGHAADRQGLVFTCECGAPSHPASARCMKCHARSRVIGEADAALLAGRPPPEPNTCRCRGCGARVQVENATSICGACEPRLMVQVDAGTVTLVIGGNVLRVLSSAEVKSLAAALAPPPRTIVAMPPELPAMEPPMPPPPEVEDPVAQLEALLAQAQREVEAERNAPK